MDIRLKAIRKTAGQMVVICIISFLVVYFSTHFSAETILNIFLIGLFSLGGWMMYNANLVDYKYEEKYSKLEDKTESK